MKILLRIAVVPVALLLGASAPAQSILGIDVSSYQGSINWSSVKADGVLFAFAQSTTGTNSKDADFKSNMSNGKAAGVLMGAAHFSEPYAHTPAQEAAYFWSFAGSNIKADNKTLMPAVELSVFQGHYGASSYTAWMNNWSSDVIADGKAAGVTLRPIIYISSCDACLLNTNITLAAWIADPGASGPWSNCESCNVWDEGGTGGWTFWQTSDTGVIAGISGEVDFDTYNGNLAQLKASELVTAF